MNNRFVGMVVLSAVVSAERMAAGGAGCAIENGDTNGDGRLDLTDPIYSLNFQFLGGPAHVAFCVPAGPPRDGCAVENGDTNGDTRQDISDALYSLSFQFLGGPAPVPACSETIEAACDDGADNDGDSALDCADSDCTSDPACLDPDRDADAFTLRDGDCDDTNPFVNPGAFEIPDNELDDDCDGAIDPPPTTCDGALESNPIDAVAYALAMDICESASESPQRGDRGWGLIRAELTLLDGSSAPNRAAHSIRAGFGTGNPPPGGEGPELELTVEGAVSGQELALEASLHESASGKCCVRPAQSQREVALGTLVPAECRCHNPCADSGADTLRPCALSDFCCATCDGAGRV